MRRHLPELRVDLESNPVNECLRDECLNEHWIVSLAHAKVMIEAWGRGYNEGRLKKSLSELTLAPGYLNNRSVI